MIQLDPSTLPPLWWSNSVSNRGFYGIAYIPSNTTPTRLMAIASAASGDPTPFEGTLQAPLGRFSRFWCALPDGAFDATRAPYIALAEALEGFIDEPNAVQFPVRKVR